MTNETFQKYLDLNILKPQSISNNYRFERPLKIIINENVISDLQSIYQPNKEFGGIFELVPYANGTALIKAVHFVKNGSNVDYQYNPDITNFNEVLNQILNNGSLPIAIHTHPTNLGIKSYDSKAVKFYLKSSKPDKQIARNGIVKTLNLPECIFVKDDRFTNGFALNFYTGWIFPASSAALTTNQIISLVVLFLAILKHKKATAILSAIVFLFEYYRKPKYNYLDNGGMEVDLSF